MLNTIRRKLGVRTNQNPSTCPQKEMLGFKQQEIVKGILLREAKFAVDKKDKTYRIESIEITKL